MELAGACREPEVEGKSRQSAKEQSCCIENVCDKVEDFGLTDGGHGQDILNVFDMAPTSKVNEDDGQGNKCDIDHLNVIALA